MSAMIDWDCKGRVFEGFPSKARHCSEIFSSYNLLLFNSTTTFPNSIIHQP